MAYDPSYLASVIAREDTVVFVGSGVSAWSGLPTWRGLLEQLAAFLPKVGQSPDLVKRELENNDLLLAASYGFDRLTARERCDFLRSSLRVPSAAPSQLHHALANLGTQCFITTNYDGLLEEALRETRPDDFFEVVNPLQLLEIASIVQARAKGFIFKPHGDLSSCDSIVLTREDYRRLHGDKRNVLDAMRTLLVSRPVIFVGYSLRDPDFLLVQDLLAASFGISPPDHYALMPDVVSEEIEYWNRNYGIHLIPYTTQDAASGQEKHAGLLRIIEDLRPSSTARKPSATHQQESDQILAFARYGRRLQSVIPAADNMIPVQLEQSYRQVSDKAIKRLEFARDACNFFASGKEKLILEGPPGAGKTFLIEQVARNIAVNLEQVCLADRMPEIESLKVPVVIYLRDYRGDVGAMLSQALPFDIRLEDLVEKGIGAFYLDGFNEAPISSLETNDLMSDLLTFASRANECQVVITTRFGDELSDLDLPIVTLDEISPGYVQQELIQAGVSPNTIDDATRELLHRPLFHNAWKGGSLALSSVRTVHDVYVQLVQKMEENARNHFRVSIAFGEVFQRMAYSMIDSGQLSMPIAEVYVSLRVALADSLDARDLVNFALSTGILVATSTRRIAFSHHSIAEYFAAQYLAKMVLSDRSALQHCLGRRDWDQSLLLTLGFLSEDDSSVVFGEIIQADRAMALRALNYVENQRLQWTRTALKSLVPLASDKDKAMSVNYALSRLKLTEACTQELLTLAQYDTILGGTAAGLLWSIDEGRKEWILDLLVNGTHDFNFLTSLARIVKKTIDLPYAMILLERASNLALDNDVAAAIKDGDDDDLASEVLGMISAMADVLEIVPSESLIRYSREHDSVLVESVICEALWRTRTPEALEFVQECILKGHDHAIFALYMQLSFGTQTEPVLPAPHPGIVEALLSAIQDGRKGQWALGIIRLYATAIPEVKSKVASMIKQTGGLMSALLAYAIGENDHFFEILARENQTSREWFKAPAVGALQHVEISWRGQEELLINLLQHKDKNLSLSLLERLAPRIHIHDSWEIQCTINDLTWWIEWLKEEQADQIFGDRLGAFLANGTDAATRVSIVRRFNDVKSERYIIEMYVLPKMLSLSFDSFKGDALEWLVAQLNTRVYSRWHLPLIAKITTEDFIQERLLPMLLEEPAEPLRGNLLLTLKEAGRLHRRRYVGEDGQVLG